jgi:hypothetical protein
MCTKIVRIRYTPIQKLVSYFSNPPNKNEALCVSSSPAINHLHQFPRLLVLLNKPLPTHSSKSYSVKNKIITYRTGIVKQYLPAYQIKNPALVLGNKSLD